MLIRRIRASGLLSFGPVGIDLPLEPLNVLIGPNGSGKSNLLELLALLQAAPRSLPEPLKDTGGVREWLWRGQPGVEEARLEAVVTHPGGTDDLRHLLVVREMGGRFEVADERIEYEHPLPGEQGCRFYDYRRGWPEIKELDPATRLQESGEEKPLNRALDRASMSPDQSILSQIRDRERYPALARLQEAYRGIRLYRNLVLGPASTLRRPQLAAGPADVVEEDFSNYQRVVWSLRKHVPTELMAHLSLMYEGAEDLHEDTLGDTILLSVREAGLGWVPATRLSDGTLRYLCLLAILLNPAPPPLIVIDEPDLGLHPDLMPTLAKLLVTASDRTQVVATTHSRALVDALSDRPEAVVVCGKDEAGTFFERLKPAELAHWLEDYSLGQLWSRGEVGGNRW